MHKRIKQMLRLGMSSIIAVSLLAGQTGMAAAQAVNTIHFTGYFDKQLRAQMAVTADSFPVVNVRLVKQDEPDMVYYDVGTSILISKDEVLTNYHVVQEFAELKDGDEGTLTVASPGHLERPIKAKIIKTDPVTDMALLKLDKDMDAEPVTFASARDNQIVYTIGFPKTLLVIWCCWTKSFLQPIIRLPKAGYTAAKLRMCRAKGNWQYCESHGTRQFRGQFSIRIIGSLV